MKTVIFDFNRTLYDPDTGALVPGVRELLDTLASNDYQLHLVSRFELGRTVALEELGIADAFKTTSFVSDKTETIGRLVANASGDSYVVGDYLYDEIRAGNRAGARTVWFKQGRFADLVPETSEDQPWRTVRDMSEVRTALLEA